MKVLEGLYPETTRRHLLNLGYQALALDNLGLKKILTGERENHKLAWLVRPRIKTSVLAELGRIENPKLMRMIAERICADAKKATKMPVKGVERAVRSWRTNLREGS